MSDSGEHFVRILKTNGYSSTAARRAVFDVLTAASAITMSELTKACAHIDRASVYRTVTLFEKLHIAHKVYSGWKYRIELSSAFHHHHHATCENCGTTIVLDDEHELEDALQKIAATHRFEIHSHQVELVGLCEKCRP